MAEKELSDMTMDEFQAYLSKRHGMEGHPKEYKVFRMAWDEGHAHGHNDVENLYIDLAELVLDDNENGKP